MKGSMPIPCSDWAQRLSARHQDDLSPADHQALKAHLASCQACHEVYMAYKALGMNLRCLAIAQPIPTFLFEPIPSRPKRCEYRPARPLKMYFVALLVMLSSLPLRLNWSPLFQKIETGMLDVLSKFPRRIAYVWSGNRVLYALRTDSGYFLWRLKRYRRGELITALPMRWGGMFFIGSGVALVTALDFCKHAVRP